MAFRVVHAQWGSVDATLPDLGCEQAWEAVWRVRPPAPLTCPECGHQMHAKVSPKPRRLRFFAHAPHAPNCALALESIDHHLLKLELVTAARAAGAHAEMEVRGPDGAWIADVLASDPGGTWRVALEAQLAPVTTADITARTDRMGTDGVASIWFSDRPRPPWLGAVPSVRLARPDDGEGLVVAGGLVKFRQRSDGSGSYVDNFLGSYWEVIPATLVQFLGWAFTGAIRPHRPRYGDAMIWTAPRYIAEHEAAAERFERIHAALQRQRSPKRAEDEERRRKERIGRQEEIARKNAASRATALEQANAAEQAARGTPEGAWRREQDARRLGVREAISFLAREYNVTADVGWSAGDPRYAGGVDAYGLFAVLHPVPRLVRGHAFLLLAGTLLLFRAEWRRALFEKAMGRTRYQPAGGYRTDYVDV
jgi:competence protein CoiA